LAGTAARRCGDAAVLASAARAAATPLRRTSRAQEALQLLQEASERLTSGSCPVAAELDAAGMTALTAAYTAAQAHLPTLAKEFAAHAEQTADRLARHQDTGAGARDLTVDQCMLYRIGIHRHLGDIDTALAYARRLRPHRLPSAERRARAATDIARALLDAGDTVGAFTQLRLIELAAPREAYRPSVRALTGRIFELQPDLPGMDEYTRRTTASAFAPC
ncbi:transcriptional regulator, partial [Streptomyces sp. NPDC002589]|uniref:transcriptional regulator n=1 Tax=Streptomyces sp. NPDC002589 TaxID=3154420 RepID=UPI00332694F9